MTADAWICCALLAFFVAAVAAGYCIGWCARRDYERDRAAMRDAAARWPR